MSMAAVFLDIEKALIQHGTLAYYINYLHYSFRISRIKLISSFLSEKKFRALVEGEMSAPRDIQAGVPQDSIIAPILYSTYK
jgi:hypothetical protein